MKKKRVFLGSAGSEAGAAAGAAPWGRGRAGDPALVMAAVTGSAQSRQCSGRHSCTAQRTSGGAERPRGHQGGDSQGRACPRLPGLGGTAAAPESCRNRAAGGSEPAPAPAPAVPDTPSLPSPLPPSRQKPRNPRGSGHSRVLSIPQPGPAPHCALPGLHLPFGLGERSRPFPNEERQEGTGTPGTPERCGTPSPCPVPSVPTGPCYPRPLPGSLWGGRSPSPCPSPAVSPPTGTWALCRLGQVRQVPVPIPAPLLIPRAVTLPHLIRAVINPDYSQLPGRGSSRSEWGAAGGLSPTETPGDPRISAHPTETLKTPKCPMESTRSSRRPQGPQPPRGHPRISVHPPVPQDPRCSGDKPHWPRVHGAPTPGAARPGDTAGDTRCPPTHGRGLGDPGAAPRAPPSIPNRSRYR